MPAGSTFANELALHLAQNATLPLIGDATGLLGAATVGSLYWSLHTADPGNSGNQTTSEAAYTGYARVSAARSSAGLTVAANVISNTLALLFPQSSSGPESETYVMLGTASTGTGKQIGRGALSQTLVVNNLIAPNIAIGAATVTIT